MRHLYLYLIFLTVSGYVKAMETEHKRKHRHTSGRTQQIMLMLEKLSNKVDEQTKQLTALTCRQIVGQLPESDSPKNFNQEATPAAPCPETEKSAHNRGDYYHHTTSDSSDIIPHVTFSDPRQDKIARLFLKDK
jgi:hypothetical protein